MREIISSSLRLRTLVVAVAALVFGFGLWQLRTASLDAVPEFTPLSLTVKTESLGLSNAEVEALITVPLEADLLNGVPWLRSIESESMTGVSTIRMSFAPGTGLMQARQMVQERLVQAPTGLPNVSSPPVLLQPVSSASRIMNIGLSSATVSLIDMTVQAHWNIVPRLVGVPGVANVSIWGRRDRQLQVQVAPDTLHQHGITLEQVVKTTGEAVFASPLTFLNSSTPGTGGFIDTPNQRLNIRHVSPLITAEHLAQLSVVETPLTLGQIASVVEGHQPLIGDAIVRGNPGVMLVVDKLPGFSTQEVTRGIEKALEELRPGLAGIAFDTQIYRPAGYIEQARSNLGMVVAIACGLLAVSLILLQGWRLALIALITIPLSLLAGWLVLHLRGIPLTVFTVAGLLMALGVVVHDAVLDVDSIARRLRQSRGDATERSPIRILLAAALEVRRPMLFATLILMLAIVPVLLAEGRFAVLLLPLAFACIAAILASLFVALTVTPALSALLLAKAPLIEPQAKGLVGRLQARIERRPVSAPRSPGAVYGIAVAALLVSAFAWTRLERDLLPSFRETDILVEWRGPEGIALPEMTRVTTNLIKDLRALPGVQNAAAHIGRAVLCNCDNAEDVNSAAVWVSIAPHADYVSTLAAIRALAAEYPGMSSRVGSYLSKKVRDALADESRRLTVRVYGQDQVILREKAAEIQWLLTRVNGISDSRVEAQTEEATIEIEVDLDRAGSHGFKPGDIRRATASLVGGITVGALFEQQKVFDVVVWGTPDIRKNITDIENLQFETDGGNLVRLSEVAQVRLAPTTSTIRRHGALRRLDIQVDVDGRAIRTVAQDIAGRLKSVSFPLEYHARVLGGDLGEASALRSVESYVIAAAILAFLVLQAAFSSWRLAAAALLGLPVVALGSIVAVLVDGRVITLGSILGCAAVLGLTLRTSIAMITYFQTLEREGMPFGEELIQRGLHDRFPSTIATLTTTGVVVLPFILLSDIAGLEIAHSMAVAMLGGLVGAVMATLVLMPTLYRRFGAGTAADKLDLESAPDLEPALR